MSSSVFYESPSDSDCDGADGTKKATDLVVVYKNNSINVNKQDLQNFLLDENTNSTISVVRLSSPTPSMNDEEDQLNNNEENISIDTSENEGLLTSLEGRAAKKSIVGLHIEGFYPPDEAKLLAKQILETAGVGKKAAMDLELRRFAFLFDHCYSKSSSDDDTDKEKQSKEKPKSPAKQRKTYYDSLQEKRKREVKPKVIDDFSYDIEDGDEEEEEEGADDEESYYTGSEESASTDNDRDSDLDFDVNDRNGKKKRKKNKKSPKKALKVKKKSELDGVEDTTKKIFTATRPSKQLGSFTDINNLANKKSNIRVTQIPNKGFVSLGPETKKLPAQISIKEIPSTPTKDKEKESVPEKRVEHPKVEEIVKMLEKSENEIQPTPSSSFSTVGTVENIDISSAPLLDDGREESIPDDILEKVVELMDDSSNSNHKTFEGFVSPSKPSDLDSFTPSFSAIKPPPVESSASTSPAVKKEPIVIVRGDGRVITLPPIEAPTTRAKRKAQSSQRSDAPEIGQIVSMSEVKVDEKATACIISAAPSVVVKKTIAIEKKKAVVAPKETSPVKRRLSRKVEKPVPVVDEEEYEDEGTVDDDDPTKLWCICRQPHNNRFMICCDTCEEWFHGSCVQITKAMNLEMEAKKQEWICPPCKEKSQPKITQMFMKVTPKVETPLKPASKVAPEVKQNVPKPITISKNPVKKQIIEIQDIQIIRPATSTAQHVKIVPVVNQQKIIIPTSIKSAHHQQPIKITNIVTTTTTSSTQLVSTAKHAKPQVTVVKLPSKTNAEIKKRSSSGISIQIPKQESSIVKEPGCIVCKIHTKNKSNFCSEECLRKYIAVALPKAVHTEDEIPNKKMKMFEDLLLSADSKPKLDRVCVFEKSTGQILTGSNAPTSANVRKWLQDHPTFEIVQTGTQQALEVEKMNILKIQKPTLTPTTLLSSPRTISSPVTIQSPISKYITTPDSAKDSSKKDLMKPSTPVASTSHKEREKKDKDKDYVPSPREDKEKEKDKERPKEKKRSHDEPIRNMVENHLFDALLKRISENLDDSFPKLSKDDLHKFCRRTEEELYKLFNRDTGQKYKNKFRSLKFNIQDPKNKQLFRKISTKEVSPHRLVRMTAEELASQELSEWRQNETKHQLDMIKQNELDLLTQPKNYVLKSHKGEEVMEDKDTDRINAGASTSVEDVVAVLNNSLESQEDYSFDYTQHSHHTSLSSLTSLEKVEKKTKDKERDKDKDRDRKSKSHKEKTHKRARSRSRERESDKHSRSPKREKVISTKHHTQIEKSDKKPVPKEKEEIKKLDSSASKTVKKRESKLEPVGAPQTFNLVDQILESTKTIEEAANIMKKEKPVAIVQPSQTKSEQSVEVASVPSESERRKLEKPYFKYYAEEIYNLWDGSINMIEVSSFQLYFQSISKCEGLDDLLTELELTVVGRINPERVWEYLGKIKRSPAKIMDILRLTPRSESEVVGYLDLFLYLKNLKRLGVIKPRSKLIKDFYIIPLSKNESLPPVLQNFSDLDFFKDTSRPDIILGVVVRFGDAPPLPPVHSHKPIVKEPVPRPSRSSFDKELDKIIKEPFLHKPKTLLPPPPPPPPLPVEDSVEHIEDDGNEPYSPGRAFDDEADTSVGKSVNNLTLDEVNRQIEEREKELQQIAASALGTGISIPHNLSQILASIPKVSTTKTSISQPDDEEYDPESSITQFSSASSSNRPLGQLSEEDLMKMVPDNVAFSDNDDSGGQPFTKKPRLK